MNFCSQKFNCWGAVKISVTPTSQRQLMLHEFLFSKIEEENIGNIWFQQDSAMCHTAEATLDVLRPVLEDRIISRRADVIWPLRSCDLIPLTIICEVPSKLSVTPTI